MPSPNLLIYLLRRDLRVEDNPVFHEIVERKDNPYTHLLPIYIFSAQQVEVSGFIPEDCGRRSPYPEARSPLGGFWRCGPHRVKFLAECVWDLKETLEGIGSGLQIRVGKMGDVVKKMFDGFHLEGGDMKVGGLWMTSEEGAEEKSDEIDIRKVCNEAGVAFRLFADEKYLIDDRDLPFNDPQDLPDVFTTYRKTMEPLRKRPRAVLPTPTKSSLPPLPPSSTIPPQHTPFSIPSSYSAIKSALLAPFASSPLLTNPPPLPPTAQSAHPFRGGSRACHERVQHLISSGSMNAYKATRNGLIGPEFSTKLSGWLAQGCVTARQIHNALLGFENGTSDEYSSASGFGEGENTGTENVRFELLWRDYMRLCNRKFGERLFAQSGFREETSYEWKSPSAPGNDTIENVTNILQRVLHGTTGMGLIDASQRELYHTGYTSNRARQNVASFVAKHLHLDWRLGAEWYECMLIDYDVSSNWGNWQYVAGVGNDPRKESRIFNPVKQSWDYDGKADYVRTWIPDLKADLSPGECFQACTVPEDKRALFGLNHLEWVEHPLKYIEFTVGKKQGSVHGGGAGRGRAAFRGESESMTRGGRGGWPSRGFGNRGYYSGRRYGAPRGGGGGLNRGGGSMGGGSHVVQ